MCRLLKGSILLVITGILILSASCTPGSCYDETEAYVKASLFSFTTKKISPPDSITIYGLNMSTKLYNAQKNVSIAKLPLNPQNGKSIFVIKINNIADTLEFNYTSSVHLISKECGYAYFHYIETPIFTHNAIDSISVSANNVTTGNEENIRIFY
ncbi:MAG TPA: DUF6452 family protein [Bacteroidales bacterium]|jgi:hypothetical protein|nr:DUF6452 family protein [Bacteroidales bacterium]